MFTRTLSISMLALSIGLASLNSCSAPPASQPTTGENTSATSPTSTNDLATPANNTNPHLQFNPADTAWTAKIEKSEDEWRQLLPAEVFEIARQEGTEPAYSSPLYELKADGIYYCACCANPLFTSATKFHSGTGWPSFWEPYARKSVAVQIDRSHGMVREEVECARCGAHLGHVFDDGPEPTGLRYCMDGLSLHFEKSN